ncbi:hypothetical protein OUZ56_031587 [Daphnia magna]|uniref:Peptidase M14 domain-containing protein n=1 Tax=Daphnia magna TaxID=35525 RepID=A0ABQ9ZVR1_9CRUS|nr:hypothetical protein OUZ56_031587 [Daphnia magna]
MKKLVVLFAIVCPIFANVQQYDGYQVYEVTAKTIHQLQDLIDLEQSGSYDFWNRIGFNAPTDIMAAPDQINQLTDYLSKSNIEYRMKISNVQQLIDRPKASAKLGPHSPRYNLTWDNYYRYDDIVEFAYELAASYPQLVSVSSAGQSYEGREMILMKISSGGDGTKNAIFVDAGIHAREWIAPATVTYIIRELVENYAAHPQYIDDVDWFFMPLINPDGYEFSHTNVRLWRKNRRPNDDVNSTCIGTDLNRNFGYHWNEGGSSDSPCNEMYHGPEAFSEAESRVVRDAIWAEANRTKSYMTVHSYGQYWLTPWGYTAELPDDYDQMYALAAEAVAALTAVYGTQYEIGSGTVLLYPNSGPSDDWAKGVAGIPYSYTIELRDKGPVYGFLLPPDQIIPSGIETWEAFKVIAENVAKMP